jgi:hypothetical protein
LAEVRAVTVTQKEIEAKISTDLWNYQMHWAQKRDVYGELIRLLGALRSTYTTLAVRIQNDALYPDVLATCNTLHDELGRQESLARIFANQDCTDALAAYYRGRNVPNVATTEWAQREIAALTTAMVEVVAAARTDLLAQQTAH